MNGIVHHLFLVLLHLGPAGLLILGILDSSFLFLPLGNDLLITAMTIRHHELLWLYVICASVGSTIGVFLLDLLLRRRGEEGIRKLVSQRRFEYLKKKMSSRAGFMIALTAIAPPPFPFTPVVAAASALNYPRTWLLGTVFAGRMVRFTIIGLLAIKFGRQLLLFAKTRGFVGVMIGIIVISLVGSILSVIRWLRQSKKKQPA
jgi:membrane protein YqaA with SNARE-associated domain